MSSVASRAPLVMMMLLGKTRIHTNPNRHTTQRPWTHIKPNLQRILIDRAIAAGYLLDLSSSSPLQHFAWKASPLVRRLQQPSIQWPLPLLPHPTLIDPSLVSWSLAIHTAHTHKTGTLYACTGCRWWWSALVLCACAVWLGRGGCRDFLSPSHHMPLPLFLVLTPTNHHSSSLHSTTRQQPWPSRSLSSRSAAPKRRCWPRRWLRRQRRRR